MSLDPSAAISALKWIVPLAVEEGNYLYQVPDQVRSLLDELQHMLQLLQDVDEHQEDLDGQLRIFAQKIQQLAFRSEDVIDTYLINFQSKIENRGCFMKFFCICCNSYPVHQIGKEIEAIQENVRVANRRLQTFRAAHLGPGRQGSNSDNNERLQDVPGRALHSKEDFVVGIEDDIKKLVDRLLEGSGLRFVAIVGTGGAGKTTLARTLHGHPRIKDHFNSRALVSISKEWNGRCILIEIIRQTIGLRDEEWSFIKELSKPALVDKLRNFLKERRYLIIIDDIWEKDAWDDISDALPEDYESKIVLTTRKDDLPPSIDAHNFIHKPRPLERKERYELLHKIAIEGRPNPNMKKFEDLAWEMSEKCSGIPLAVVSLAGVLSSKNELYHWERVKNSLAVNILKGKGSGNYGVVKDMLALSYHDLPSYLRSCLLYLAIFSEDRVIHTGMLIRMWIAEGLVTESDRQDQQETLEDVGICFLDELIKRYLLITVRRDYEGKLKEFRLHDLVRDFCIEKTKEQCLLEVISHSDDQRTSHAKGKIQARRIAVHSRETGRGATNSAEHDGIDIGTLGVPTLRSLIQFGHDYKYPAPSRTAWALSLKTIHQNFKLLKILCLREVHWVVLPDQIGNLTHLKHFDLKRSYIRGHLPNSIKNLRNLLTLDVRVVSSISLSKNFFEKMGQLRHAYFAIVTINRSKYCRIKTLGLGNSKNLQTLYCLAGMWMIEELSMLWRLRKLLVCDISSKQQMEAIYRCPSLNYLYILCLAAAKEGDLAIDMKILEHCSQLRNLKLFSISIIGEVGGQNESIRFPQNLVSLTLCKTNLEKQESIAAIARLPSLKYLALQWESYLGEELIIERNSFLQLEEFHIDELSNLQEWRFEIKGEEGSFLLPCLRKISIAFCFKLKSLPQGLQHISTLQELVIRGNNKEFYKRLEKGKGEDFHIIQHIPFVKLM